MSPSGLEIDFKNQAYVITYPDDIWKEYPENMKEFLFDNIVYAATIHLPLVFEKNKILYNTSPPLFQPYFFQNFIMDLPSCADVDDAKTSRLIQLFLNLKALFNDNNTKLPKDDGDYYPSSSVVSFSFGKDSLLTFTVAREIGLNPEVVYITEPSLKYEEKHKDALAKRLHLEIGVELHKIIHTTGLLRDPAHIGVRKTELGWGLQSTEYALLLLPFARKFQAEYILFGNENSCSVHYYDKEGYICYPAYDQTHTWTLQIDNMTRMTTNNKVKTVSLIEPLNDIAVMAVLNRRYPEIAKYEMSCFTETEAGRNHRWCQSCSVCCKMYLLLVAIGVNPKRVGFTKDMLSDEYKEFFSLFGGKKVVTYALTNLGRDEQLFAFYLAHKNGNRSDLVKRFEKLFLKEAKEREDELQETFLSVRRSITVPPKILQQVNSIYREELEIFR